MSTLSRGQEIEENFYHLKAQEWGCSRDEAKLEVITALYPHRPGSLTYVIEVSSRSGNEKWYTVLHPRGARGTAENKRQATQMTLPEAWCVLREIERNPTSEMAYAIVEGPV